MSDEAYEAFMEANYDSGRSLPEGLHLAYTPAEGSLAIFDAGDLMWVEFCEGGLGDPVEWPKEVVRKTCAALGVTLAVNDAGDECSIDKMLDEYYGDVDFLD